MDKVLLAFIEDGELTPAIEKRFRRVCLFVRRRNEFKPDKLHRAIASELGVTQRNKASRLLIDENTSDTRAECFLEVGIRAFNEQAGCIGYVAMDTHDTSTLQQLFQTLRTELDTIKSTGSARSNARVSATVQTLKLLPDATYLKHNTIAGREAESNDEKRAIAQTYLELREQGDKHRTAIAVLAGSGCSRHFERTVAEWREDAQRKRLVENIKSRLIKKCLLGNKRDKTTNGSTASL